MAQRDISGPTPPGMPTGLERIATLEAEMRGMREKLEEISESQKTVESLLLQGRGAVRVTHWLLGFAGVFGVGWISHTRIADFLKWAGS